MRVGRAVMVVGLLLVLSCGLPPSASAAPSASTRTATLPTGDRVTIVGDAHPAVSIRPAAGREHMVFHKYATRDHLYVVPQDVIRRFDTGKAAQGYDLTRLLPPNRRTPAARTEPPGETVDLTITLRDVDGAVTGDYSVAIVGLDDGRIRFPYDPDGSLTVTLPKGRYFVDSVVNTTAPDGTRHMHVLPHPNTRLVHDTILDVPAAAARPVRVTPPDPSAALLLGDIGFNVVTPNALADVSLLTDDLSTVSIAQLGPSLPADVLTTMVDTQWATPGGDFYGLAWFPKGTVPTGFTTTVARKDLAAVRVDLGTQIPGDIGLRFAVPDSVSADVLAASAQVDVPLPSVRTEYYNAGVQWNITLYQVNPADTTELRAILPGGQYTFQPGRHYSLPINHGPFGPAFPAQQVAWACRCADAIDFFLPLLGDSAGNAGTSLVDTVTITLSRNGQLVGTSDDEFAAIFPVPPEPADYRITADLTRSGLFTTSTHVSAEWTFRSGHAAEDVTLPLSAIIFSPALDQNNAAPAGQPFVVPVALQPQSTNDLVRPRQLSVDVSYDEGRTWRKANTIDNRAVLLHHPAGATSVSLRATATDNDGNAVTETLVRAYTLTNR